MERRIWIAFCLLALVFSAVSYAGAQEAEERSVAGLIHDLNHPDAERRIEAARLLGEHEVRSAVPELIKLADDTDPDVRYATAKALQEIHDSRALEAFIRLARDSETRIQSVAVDGIVDIYVIEEGGFVTGVKKVFTFLNPLSDGYDSRVVEPYVPISQDAVNAVIDLLFHEDTGMREKAATALGILRAESALPAIEDALNREDSDSVKVALIRAIYKIGSSEGGEAVVPFIRDSDKGVHDEAILTAGRLKVQEAVPILNDIYRVGVEERRKILGFVPVSGTDDLQKKVLEALSFIGDSSSQDIFEGALNDERTHYRRYAAEGLGRMGDDAYVGLLARHYLREESSEVKLAMGYALFRLGREEHIVELVDHAQDEQAYYYLLEFSPEEVELLFPYLHTGTVDNVVRLLSVVGLRGGESALPVVQEMSSHENVEIASAANLAIRRLHGRFPQE